jgi:hypothetical protein
VSKYVRGQEVVGVLTERHQRHAVEAHVRLQHFGDRGEHPLQRPLAADGFPRAQHQFGAGCEGVLVRRRNVWHLLKG